MFEKKIDKGECEKERIFAEKFRIENIKTLTKGISRIEERMTRIEGIRRGKIFSKFMRM
ncbi:hypothetical protein [Fusobacterium varium]|uniref:hypothetical protein n=1 Tax=Fusobacterium varium TaxID=856 RepID=UPI00243195BC|nr:hypothetical protein [Fusobacterium varium]